MSMDFSYIISLLSSNIHPIPDKHRETADLVIEILTKGQGYLRKEAPVRIIFFDDNAK